MPACADQQTVSWHLSAGQGNVMHRRDAASLRFLQRNFEGHLLEAANAVCRLIIRIEALFVLSVRVSGVQG